MGDRMPAVGRPRGAAWRALHTEGIVWEGQVLIVGDETDLAARLVVTHQRLAFARGGAVALDIERGWLRPPPALNADGTILLLVTLPDERSPEPIRLLVPEGRRAAAHLVSLLSGTGVRPVVETRPRFVPELLERAAREQADRPRRVEPMRAREPNNVLPAIATLDADDFPPLSTSGPPAARPSVSRPTTPEPEPEPELARMLPAPATTTGEVVRDRDWNLQPLHGIAPRSTRQGRRGWVIRLSGLVLLVALAAYGASHFSEDRGRELASRLPGVSIETPANPTATSSTAPTTEPTTSAPPTATATATSEITVAEVPTNATTNAEKTAIALGVGGPESTIEPLPDPPATNEPTATEEPTNTESPTDTPEPTATEEPTETTAPSPTETAAPTETEQPTEEPTTPPTDTAAPTDTTAPTETAVPTDTQAPTETTAPPDTVAPSATSEPSATATDEPTQTPKPTKTPKPSPTPTPTSLVRAQSPSLGGDEIARQAVLAGNFRYTIETAVRGVELPELALPNPGNGEWVVLVVNALNWTDENAQLNMTDFRLAPAGSPGLAVALDPSTDAIASFLGFVPAFQHDDAVLFAPGESHRLALVFLVSPGLGDLMLMAGPSSMDLALSLANPAEITDLGNPPKAPELLKGTVTRVIDGRTIEVEVQGETVQVVYLGVAVPTGDDCYTAQATAANNDLVMGKTVWLEREWKNRAPKGAVARDVWFVGPDGTRRLIAAELAARGAAASSPVEPDIRYAGAISAAATTAQYAGLGFWGVCGGPPLIETNG